MFILVNPKLGKIWNNTLTINNNGKDLIAPDPDCIRKDGFIVSVPGFVRYYPSK